MSHFALIPVGGCRLPSVITQIVCVQEKLGLRWTLLDCSWLVDTHERFVHRKMAGAVGQPSKTAGAVYNLSSWSHPSVLPLRSDRGSWDSLMKTPSEALNF